MKPSADDEHGSSKFNKILTMNSAWLMRVVRRIPADAHHPCSCRYCDCDRQFPVRPPNAPGSPQVVQSVFPRDWFAVALIAVGFGWQLVAIFGRRRWDFWQLVATQFLLDLRMADVEHVGRRPLRSTGIDRPARLRSLLAH
jgi:hypothetical protein